MGEGALIWRMYNGLRETGVLMIDWETITRTRAKFSVIKCLEGESSKAIKEEEVE